jgi:penicillin V acylase-like amidase (Ntn superfamily)
MKKISLFFLSVLLSYQLPACLILFLTNGKEVFIANHEDWAALDAEVSFHVPGKNKYGYMSFDFASEGWAQGGMNTKGLFFDGTATPYAPYAENENKKDCNCYLWTKILEECSTVEQAISYVKKYRVPDIENIHLLFADKNGSSAIIGVYNNELKVYYRNGNYQLLTNFNIADPSYGGEEPCRRFDTAAQMLKRDSSANIDNLENILSKTNQDITAYSNIYNLSKGEVTLYYLHDFSKKIKFNLAAELKKGNHKLLLSSLFGKK